MPKNILLYDLLISCPGDIKSEIEVIEEVVEEFNQQFATTLGISIRTRHWSKSAYAQSGGKPQELLNKQFVDNCDAAVALFLELQALSIRQFSGIRLLLRISSV